MQDLKLAEKHGRIGKCRKRRKALQKLVLQKSNFKTRSIRYQTSIVSVASNATSISNSSLITA